MEAGPKRAAKRSESVQYTVSTYVGTYSVRTDGRTAASAANRRLNEMNERMKNEQTKTFELKEAQPQLSGPARELPTTSYRQAHIRTSSTNSTRTWHPSQIIPDRRERYSHHRSLFDPNPFRKCNDGIRRLRSKRSFLFVAFKPEDFYSQEMQHIFYRRQEITTFFFDSRPTDGRRWWRRMRHQSFTCLFLNNSPFDRLYHSVTKNEPSINMHCHFAAWHA